MSSNYLTADNGVSSGVTGITQSAGNDGTLQIRTTTSGGTATTAVIIDNSQNVQLGLTTNPQSSRLTVQGAASSIADFESTITTTSGGGIRVSNSGTTELWIGYYQFASNMGAGVTDAGLSARNNLLLDGTNAILFGQNGTEKGRFDSSGNLLVGYTSGGASATSTVRANGYNCKQGIGAALAANSFNMYWNGGSMVLYVDTTSLGSITTTSDYRLKENVATQDESALLKVMQLNPVKFNRKTDGIFVGSDAIEEGFIAHELQAVIPSAVLGEKDAVTEDGKIQPQTLTLAPIVSVLTKAIQELSAQVTTLQATVETQATTIATLQNKIGA